VDILPRVTPENPDWEKNLRLATSRDTKVQTKAELALARSGRRVLPYLLEVLEVGKHERDSDPRLLDAVVRVLHRIEHRTARTTLRQLARRGPTKLRATALACLGQKPDATAVDIAFAALGAESREVQAQARRIIRRAGKRADDRLAGALGAWRDQDEEELEVMVRLVGNNWIDGVIPHLVEILRHPSPRVRRATVRTLIRAQSAPARDRMLAADGVRERLKDESGDVRMQAVLTMRALGDESDLEDLAELLLDSHSGAQDAARVTLAVLTGVDVGRSYFAWKRYLETGDAF
jgi:HEAT repeat protein